MRENSISYEEAVERVRQARPCVKPNSSFEEQLKIRQTCGYEVKGRDGKLESKYMRYKKMLKGLMPGGRRRSSKKRPKSSKT